jgi:hypothetical protein
MVREPIRQGARLELGFSPRSKQPNNLLPGFDSERFMRLAGAHAKDFNWQQNLFSIPTAAEEYLGSHIAEGTLIVSYEMPPWLKRICEARGLDFIDVSTSPLRFGRDLYVALRTSSSVLYERIAAQAVAEEEIRLEAPTLQQRFAFNRNIW